LRHFKNCKEIYAEIERRGAGMYREIARGQAGDARDPLGAAVQQRRPARSKPSRLAAD
jgi:hypothetical protein